MVSTRVRAVTASPNLKVRVELCHLHQPEVLHDVCKAAEGKGGRRNPRKVLCDKMASGTRHGASWTASLALAGNVRVPTRTHVKSYAMCVGLTQVLTATSDQVNHPGESCRECGLQWKS